MRKFDTKIQHLNYKVTREVAKLAWKDKLLDNLMDIPEKLSPGKQPTMRCCVYKERAILAERVPTLPFGLQHWETDRGVLRS